VHGNSANGLTRALPYARRLAAAGDPRLADAITAAASSGAVQQSTSGVVTGTITWPDNHPAGNAQVLWYPGGYSSARGG
jgi:hypothetical protein